MLCLFFEAYAYALRRKWREMSQGVRSSALMLYELGKAYFATYSVLGCRSLVGLQLVGPLD